MRFWVRDVGHLCLAEMESEMKRRKNLLREPLKSYRNFFRNSSQSFTPLKQFVSILIAIHEKKMLKQSAHSIKITSRLPTLAIRLQSKFSLLKRSFARHIVYIWFLMAFWLSRQITNSKIARSTARQRKKIIGMAFQTYIVQRWAYLGGLCKWSWKFDKNYFRTHTKEWHSKFAHKSPQLIWHFQSWVFMQGKS